MPAVVLVAGRRARPAQSKSKVYKGTFEYVGADGDYVTGKFGKVQLVDGKRNDKLSVHVRRLALEDDVHLPAPVRAAACAADAPAGPTSPAGSTSTLQDQPQGRGQLDRPLAHVHARTRRGAYFVGVYTAAERRAGRAQSCARELNTQEQAEAGKPDKPHGKPDKPHEAGQARQADKPHGKPASRRRSDAAAGQADDKQRGKSEDAPRQRNGQDKARGKSKGKPAR